MRVNGLPLMTLNGAMFSRTASGTISLWREFNRFAQATVFSPWHACQLGEKVFKDSGEFQRFLNQGMSLTDLGTLMFEPFRFLSLLVLRVVAAALVFSTTFSATFWPWPTAFLEAVFVESVAFLVEDFAFEAPFLAALAAFPPAFLAALAAFPPAFLAAAFVPPAALAAREIFLATEAVSPAFCKSPRLAFASLATVPNFAAFSFFAVAAPMPGNDVMPEPFAFPAIVSPVPP